MLNNARNEANKIDEKKLGEIVEKLVAELLNNFNAVIALKEKNKNLKATLKAKNPTKEPTKSIESLPNLKVKRKERPRTKEEIMFYKTADELYSQLKENKINPDNALNLDPLLREKIYTELSKNNLDSEEKDSIYANLISQLNRIRHDKYVSGNIKTSKEEGEDKKVTYVEGVAVLDKEAKAKMKDKMIKLDKEKELTSDKEEDVNAQFIRLKLALDENKLTAIPTIASLTNTLDQLIKVLSNYTEKSNLSEKKYDELIQDHRTQIEQETGYSAPESVELQKLKELRTKIFELYEPSLYYDFEHKDTGGERDFDTAVKGLSTAFLDLKSALQNVHSPYHFEPSHRKTKDAKTRTSLNRDLDEDLKKLDKYPLLFVAKEEIPTETKELNNQYEENEYNPDESSYKNKTFFNLKKLKETLIKDLIPIIVKDNYEISKSLEKDMAQFFLQRVIPNIKDSNVLEAEDVGINAILVQARELLIETYNDLENSFPEPRKDIADNNRIYFKKMVDGFIKFQKDVAQITYDKDNDEFRVKKTDKVSKKIKQESENTQTSSIMKEEQKNPSTDPKSLSEEIKPSLENQNSPSVTLADNSQNASQQKAPTQAESVAITKKPLKGILKKKKPKAENVIKDKAGIGTYDANPKHTFAATPENATDATVKSNTPTKSKVLHPTDATVGIKKQPEQAKITKIPLATAQSVTKKYRPGSGSRRRKVTFKGAVKGTMPEKKKATVKQREPVEKVHKLHFKM